MLCDTQLVSFHSSEIFKEIDKDNNGTINCDEFSEFLEKFYKLIGHKALEKDEARFIFQSLDNNKDGEL